jgi:hypothetical protein
VKDASSAFLASLWSHIDTRGECWIWEKKKGPVSYPEFKGTLKRRVRVTRLMLELQTGNRLEEDIYACHHCDNPYCVRPSHLFAGTQKDNARDMVAKGRMKHQKKASAEAAAERRRQGNDTAA